MVKTKVSYTGRIQTTVPVELDVELTENDIYNWLQNCRNPEALKYLGRAALNAARRIENPLEDDDFRSRA